MKKTIKLSSLLAICAVLTFTHPATAQTGDGTTTTTTRAEDTDDDDQDWGWIGLAGLLGLLGLRKRNDHQIHTDRGTATHGTNR